jgi:hypothetical protein
MLHLSGIDLFLSNTAGFVGVGADQWGSARLELPRAPRRHEYVSVIAVETIDQVHALPPIISMRRAGDSLTE